MAIAALKLESFSSRPPQIQILPDAQFTQADIDQARSEGLAEGLESRAADEISALRQELDRMAEMIEADGAQQKALHTQAVATLLPVVSEIVDAMAPSIISQRLESSLREELERMANEEQPKKVQIICSETLKELVEQCAADSKLSDYDVECTTGNTITISRGESCLKLSQERITQQIRTLIEEIKEDAATWMM